MCNISDDDDTIVDRMKMNFSILFLNADRWRRSETHPPFTNPLQGVSDSVFSFSWTGCQP